MWFMWIGALLHATHSATLLTRTLTTTRSTEAMTLQSHHNHQTGSPSIIDTVRSTTTALDEEANGNDRTPDEFTFPPARKSSFMEYREEWPEGEGRSLKMRFSFRTTSNDGFLFLHTYRDSLERDRPRMTGFISQGILRVRFSAGNISHQIDAGNGRPRYIVIL